MSTPPPDNKLFRPILTIGIVTIILGILFATGYFYSGPYVQVTILVAGIGIMLLGVICIALYVIRPEGMRQAILAKWEEKQAKKA
ncbi:MAG: hypothetical protein GF353_10500 [Candidatus Lokiarchaeota archaeon]|nr:hypothetical protein [Candidatus Lokiarchaeota archaeon]